MMKIKILNVLNVWIILHLIKLVHVLLLHHNLYVLMILHFIIEI